MAAAGVVPAKLLRLENALATARWVDAQLTDSDSWRVSEDSRRPGLPQRARQGPTAGLPGNIFIFCASLDAIDWKHRYLGGPLYDGVIIDNFGKVLALLLTDRNSDVLALGVLADFVRGNRDPYSERDLDKVISQARDFYYEATRLPNRDGFAEKELKNLADFLGKRGWLILFLFFCNRASMYCLSFICLLSQNLKKRMSQINESILFFAGEQTCISPIHHNRK